MKYNQCLCEYCTNVESKVTALQKFCTAKHLEPIATDKYNVSRRTLCEKDDGFYKKTCIDRTCDRCGTSLIKDQAATLLQEHGQTEINWLCWEVVEVTTIFKGKEVQKRQMTQKVYKTTVQHLINKLIESLSEYSRHLFNAQWQSNQFEKLKANIPEKHVLLCLDFGQNYTCHFQDEAQSAHWSYEQVTVHPIVAYYRCPQCNNPMHESFVVVSDDLKHDQHAVHHFLSQVNNRLIQKLEIEKEVQFSDGSPTQYKSKINFADMTMWEEDFGFVVENNYFGTRHGKGPCDGEVGVVKRCVIEGVKTRETVIANAKDFFEYAKKRLTLPKNESEHTHTKRSFLFIKEGEIKRDRPKDIKAVRNTRTTHQFRPVAPFVITTRERSCFCNVCLELNEGECKFQRLVGDWRISTINLKINRRSAVNFTNQDEFEVLNPEHGQHMEVLNSEPEQQMEILNPELGQQMGVLNSEPVQQIEVLNPELGQQMEMLNTESGQEMDVLIPQPGQQMVIELEIPEQQNQSASSLQDISIDSNFDALAVSFSDTEFDNTGIDVDEVLKTLDTTSRRNHEMENELPCTKGVNISTIPDKSTESGDESDIKPGRFVSVQLPVGKKFKKFVGEVMDVSGNEVHVKYMVEQSPNVFFWPSREDNSLEPEDKSWEPKENIELLPHPELICEKSKIRTQFFKF